MMEATALAARFYMPQSTCSSAPPQFLALLAKDNIAQSCIGNRSLSNVQNSNFAPRIGFAYRIRPDFVIRGGYGIAYGSLANIGAAPYVLGNNFPFAYSVTYTAPNPTDAGDPFQRRPSNSGECLCIGKSLLCRDG